MSIDDHTLKRYWRAVSGLNDRLVASTGSMCDWVLEIPQEEIQDPLRGVVEEFTRKFGDDFFSAAQLRRHPKVHSLPSDSGPQLVSGVDNRFLDGLALLVEELQERLAAMPDDRYKNSIRSILSENVHTLASRFGSFTAAWDHLVIVKFETSIPHARRRRFDAWFTEVVGIAERFIRDVIGLTILRAGREVVARPLMECFSSPDLDIPDPTPAQLMTAPTMEAALADCVRAFMDRGPWQTTQYASKFADALEVRVFAHDGCGFRPGILDRVPFLEGNCEDAWTRVLEVRKAMVEQTTDELKRSSSTTDPLLETLYHLDQNSLRLIPDFLCALCFGFAIRMIVAVARLGNFTHPALVKALQRQLSGELRVLIMRLLEAGRYELAWEIIQVALEIEPPDSPGLMLRLNAYFARLQFDGTRVDRREIEQLDVGDVPRYVLLKASILGNLDRRELRPVLERALTSGDVSLGELRTWPALGPVRRSNWWSDWVSEHD